MINLIINTIVILIMVPCIIGLLCMLYEDIKEIISLIRSLK